MVAALGAAAPVAAEPLAAAPGATAPKTTQGIVGVTTRVFHPTNLERNWRGDAEKDLRSVVWYPAVASAVEVKQTVGAKNDPVNALFEAGMAAPDAALAEPREKHGWPMVLLSHGTGGSALQMAWLGTALARSGFIAVAVDHPGKTAEGKLTPEALMLWWERATDMSQVLDGMLVDAEFGKKIDQDKIGAAGYGLGGYTVLELAGAQTDVHDYFDLCKENADAAVCHMPEMRSLGTPIDVLHAVRKTSAISLAESDGLFSDDRISAIFAMAPEMAFTLTEDSLRSIHMPLEIVVGDGDNLAPSRDNAGYVRSTVRGAKLTSLPHVGHYTFFDTCTADGKKTQERYCEDGNGVDRDAVHARVAGMAAAFFEKALKAK